MLSLWIVTDVASFDAISADVVSIGTISAIITGAKKKVNV